MPQDPSDFLSGGGEMGARMRAIDWATTPLGPAVDWPQTLKTCVRIVLTSRQPMFVWWGESLVNLYNDAYKSIVGGKHPEALGQVASVVWREIWDQVGPRAAQTMRGNEGTYDEGLLLVMERNGYREETYCTFSFSPVPNDIGGTGGIICATTENTERIIGERQIALLRELAARTSNARHIDEAVAHAASALASNTHDLPFSLIYLIDADNRRAVLAGTAGIDRSDRVAPESVPLQPGHLWCIAEVADTREARTIDDLTAHFDDLPKGAWPVPPSRAIAVPIPRSGRTGCAGVLVAALNPYRLLDDSYRGFLGLVAGQIGESIASGQAYEDEELSHQNEERFRTLVDSVTDYAIFMLDATGCVQTWNSGAEKTKGYGAAEIIGKHFSVFYTPEDRVAGKPGRILEIVRREGRYEDESWRVRKDGTRFWADVVITVRRNKDGEIVGFAKVTRDLTERREAERREVERRELESANRAKDDFLAIMGHELRNPLAPMLTAVHLIKLRRGIQCERELAVLDRQLVHMIRLLDDLLDVSRLIRNKVELTKQPIEIGAVIANAVDVSAQLIKKRRHTLRLDVPTESLVVDVDADRITQVFGNLLNNAAKYTEDGGVIWVRAEAQNENVEVTIEDTGLGIAPDVLPYIFELFVQGQQSSERQLGGFGIGLSVAKKLVTEHGGDIRAESAGLGRGSRFTVTLPRSTTAPLDLARPMSPSIRRAPVRRRVLVVDDNRDSAEMIEDFLGQLGHEVCVALDGPQALKVSQNFKPEIAFLDIGLPGMNGFELARRLREIPNCATIPIIAVSGYARDCDRRQALAAGFTDHFSKPIDPTRLERLVEHAARASD